MCLLYLSGVGVIYYPLFFTSTYIVSLAFLSAYFFSPIFQFLTSNSYDWSNISEISHLCRMRTGVV
jgi:hypothetical protein